jgi:cobalt-precorrin-5B (C1)-methyltransferase
VGSRKGSKKGVFHLQSWHTTVSGHRRNRLRSGFTTGAAAAAATKAALIRILESRLPAKVRIEALSGQVLSIAVHRCRQEGPDKAICSVIKDAGDDPDVTHRAEIGARVTLLEEAAAGGGHADVRITGGEGVGRVTKPGLEVPPGQPAINPGPRTMITRAASEMLAKHASSRPVLVEVFVPQGESLARKTLNARLGIIGGISILGTTGIVTPMSHEAYIATIRSAVAVAKAGGNETVVLTTGRRSERFSQALLSGLPEEAFIQIGDYFRRSMEIAAGSGIETVILAVFFAKALKMAQKIPHTHAAKSALSLQKLADWTLEITGRHSLARQIRRSNTARHAFEQLVPEHTDVITAVGRRMQAAGAQFGGPGVAVSGVIFDYEGRVVYDSRDRHP